MSNDDGLSRRLATVFFADVVDCTRLTEADEAGTHRALRDSLTVIGNLVTAHEGIVAHYAGDAVLAEFLSVIHGLNCAVEIQSSVAELNAPATNSPRFLFRIGVIVGDMIADEGEIYGDTVNAAVRLQSLAEPGGVCISEAVCNAIGRSLPLAYEFIGEERLKSLTIPVRAYRILLETERTMMPEADPGGKPKELLRRNPNLSAAALTDRLPISTRDDRNRFLDALTTANIPA